MAKCGLKAYRKRRIGVIKHRHGGSCGGAANQRRRLKASRRNGHRISVAWLGNASAVSASAWRHVALMAMAAGISGGGVAAAIRMAAKIMSKMAGGSIMA